MEDFTYGGGPNPWCSMIASAPTPPDDGCNHFLDLVQTGVLALSRHCPSPMLAARAAMRVYDEATLATSLEGAEPLEAAEAFLEVHWQAAVDRVCEEAKVEE